MKPEEFESIVTRLEVKLDELEAVTYFGVLHTGMVIGAIVGGITTTLCFVLAKHWGWL